MIALYAPRFFGSCSLSSRTAETFVHSRRSDSHICSTSYSSSVVRSSFIVVKHAALSRFTIDFLFDVGADNSCPQCGIPHRKWVPNCKVQLSDQMGWYEGRRWKFKSMFRDYSARKVFSSDKPISVQAVCMGLKLCHPLRRPIFSKTSFRYPLKDTLATTWAPFSVKWLTRV